MKIGILFSNYMYSYIRPFLELCKKHEIEVDFFKFAHDKISFDIKAKNIYVINSKWKFKDFNTNIAIENEIKKLVNTEEYDYFLSDTMGLSFKNACNFFHGHTTKYKIEHTSKGFLQWFLKLSHYNLIKKEKQYYKNTRFCFVGSKEMQSDYEKNCNIEKEKIKILYPGKDNKIVSEVKKKSPDETFTIGAVTCGFQLKGGYNILKAVRILKKEFLPEQIHFKLINPKFDKQWHLKIYVKLLGIENYVDFLPFQDNINNFYSEIDCLLCASNSEAFGRVVTEAMISGLPVIAGSNVGASDIIENEINGYVYNYEKNEKSTVQNLVHSINRAYRNRNNNIELINNAIKTASSVSWQNFAENLFKILLIYSR